MSAILLHPLDNILIAAAPIRSGDPLTIDGETFPALADIGVGHKIARRDLGIGEKITKYGAPVGSITQATPRGGHVHMHNMKSDYIATHMRDVVGGSEGH